MEVTVKKTIWIDEEEIAKSFLSGTFNDVLAAVDEYCAELDDCDYYALDDNAYEEIEREVEKIVINRKKEENKMEYLVIYYAGYGDYDTEDENIRIFKDKDKAIEYKNKLNNNKDITNSCQGEYIVESIKKGDK